MVCGAGDAPPAGVAKEIEAGLVTRSGVVATTTVTGIDSGLLAAAAPVDAMVAPMLIEPVQVPAVNPTVAIDTEIVPSVEPAGELDAPFNRSHPVPQVVVTG